MPDTRMLTGGIQKLSPHPTEFCKRLLLYDFTQKCFMGDLKIWPLGQYEEIEALDPELRARMGTGEASFDEFIEALDRVCHRTPASHSQ